MRLEALAKALWEMFAVGMEANKWDDKARRLWYPKAERMLARVKANEKALDDAKP
jgi:hypothetical protein